jgi:hypothetical protein
VIAVTKNDKITRNVLFALGLGLVAIGIAYIFFPLQILSFTGGYHLDSSALTDLKATYGGLQIGLGIYVLFALRQGEYSACLRLIWMIFAAVGSLRLISYLMYNDVILVHLLAGIAELGCSGLLLLLSKKADRS